MGERHDDWNAEFTCKRPDNRVVERDRPSWRLYFSILCMIFGLGVFLNFEKIVAWLHTMF